MDISLLLQALLQLLRHSPEVEDGETDDYATELVENSAKLDLLGTHGAPSVIGSVMSLCGFIINNPSQQLYCEESGVRLAPSL